MGGHRKSRTERREEILACAKAAFADKGYHAVTVDDIVRTVDVSRGTFYLYFPDKRAIFEALVDGFFLRITGAIRSIDLTDARPPLAQLRANLERLADLALAEPEMMKVVLQDTLGVDAAFDAKIRDFYRALRQFLGESLEEGQRIGLVRGGDTEILVTLSLGALKEILLGAVTGELPRSAAELTDEIVHFLEHGLIDDPSA